MNDVYGTDLDILLVSAESAAGSHMDHSLVVSVEESSQLLCGAGHALTCSYTLLHIAVSVVLSLDRIQRAT